MGDGFQFLDIIVFALIAGFLVLRLRSVLGRRTGNERRRDPFVPPKAGTVSEKVVQLPPRSGSATAPAPAAVPSLPPGVAELKRAEPSFSSATPGGSEGTAAGAGAVADPLRGGSCTTFSETVPAFGGTKGSRRRSFPVRRPRTLRRRSTRKPAMSANTMISRNWKPSPILFHLTGGEISTVDRTFGGKRQAQAANRPFHGNRTTTMLCETGDPC